MTSVPIEITCRLDKAVTAPGESVILEELIPSKMKAKVASIHHNVLRIGRYDSKLRKLVNLDNNVLFHVNPDNDFADLPRSLGCGHPYSFDVITPREKGAEFTFRPKYLGIYLITAEWLLFDNDQWIASSPVVLMVKPPMDKNGRPIVKPEWLRKDDR